METTRLPVASDPLCEPVPRAPHTGSARFAHQSHKLKAEGLARQSGRNVRGEDAKAAPTEAAPQPRGR
jgi:hypothetical protein